MSLEDIVKDEYSTYAVGESAELKELCDIYSRDSGIGSADKGYEKFINAAIDLESRQFEQGFIRGIACAKGGAV